MIPSKANPEAQREFVRDTLYPLIQKAQDNLIELFFVDASHFVMGGFIGRVWSIVRKYVRSSSGRKRFNVLGAVNFITKKMETIVNTTYITSVQVVELLEKLHENYSKPIKVILDNAAYQRCTLVREKALELGIELIFLPTYSPNLNLIERVWKLVKSKVLNSTYFETFNNFCSTIETCVDNLHTLYANEMKTLITPSFHIINTNNVINDSTTFSS